MKQNNPGFEDEQVEPYTFNPAPFLADQTAVQQGYLTSEPYEIERQAGFTPKVFLLADAGYRRLLDDHRRHEAAGRSNRTSCKRFVEATIIGWYNYLYGDNAAANALIKTDNPEMTDGRSPSRSRKMKEYGIVISGEAETRASAA